MFENFNLKNEDKKYLTATILFSTILVAYYINFNTQLGIHCSDVYLYLLNALYFTGTPIHYPENIYLSPIICFLTSLLFRLGLVDKIAIFIVTGAISIIGNVGLYLLLKRYFNGILSLTGVIVYATCTLNLAWLANGSLDISAVTLTIWIALLGIIAIKENPKYYRYLFILLALGFFTRYTTMLIFPGLVLYYVYENGFKIKSEDRKDLLIGILLGIGVFGIIISIIYVMSNGNLLLTDQFTRRISNTTGSVKDPAYNPDIYYYLKNMLNFISNSHTGFDGNPKLENPTVISYLIGAIMVIGTAIWLKTSRLQPKKQHLISLILFAVAILTFKEISSMITVVIVFLGLYILGKDSDYKVAYFMAGWILANMIFFSAFEIKVNRYILPIFPALIYFIVKSIDIIHENVKVHKNIIPLILIVLFVVQGFAFTFTYVDTHEFSAQEDISNYIITHDDNYKNVKIGAYNMRPYLWYLGYNVTGIESSAVSAIDSSNITYYISDKQLDLNNYTEIKTVDKLHLYKLNF